MNNSDPKPPRNLTEWCELHPERVFFKYNKIANTVFAKIPTKYLCPWCGADCVEIQKYSFVDRDYVYSFPGCANYPKCDWTAMQDGTMIEKENKVA